MVEINLIEQTYVCPFCKHDQAYHNSYVHTQNVGDSFLVYEPEKKHEIKFEIYTLMCNNIACRRVTVTAIRKIDGYQVDIIPRSVMKCYPEYIPEQIRNDYTEANLVLDSSPKAAATLLRRCLQGMIHDFWDVHEKNLNAEITALQKKIPQTQWQAIDGLRKLGNIGAHMENDVNIILDIDPDEAKKLLKLIELLLDKWYVARHDEEELLKGITEISEEKEAKRKDNDPTNQTPN